MSIITSIIKYGAKMISMHLKVPIRKINWLRGKVGTSSKSAIDLKLRKSIRKINRSSSYKIYLNLKKVATNKNITIIWSGL